MRFYGNGDGFYLRILTSLKVTLEQIAVHMLIGAWKETVKHEEIDRYHWINASGLLSVETIQAAAREVW